MGQRGPKKGSPQPLQFDTETGAAVFTVTMRNNGPRRGESYRLLVDLEDFAALTAWTWTPVWQTDRERFGKGKNNNKDHVYFLTDIPLSDGRYKRTSMHRFIMERHRSIASGQLVGFQDHNYFDLRKYRLRVGTQAEINQRMRKTVKKTTSAFRGVSFEWRYGSPRRWIAQASRNNRLHRIGFYPPVAAGELQAARDYDCFVLANFDNPNPNFPASDYTVEQVAAFKRNLVPVKSCTMETLPSPPCQRVNAA